MVLGRYLEYLNPYGKDLSRTIMQLMEGTLYGHAYSGSTIYERI